MECELAELNDDERSDPELSGVIAEPQSPVSQILAKTIVRRRMADGMLTITQAAQGIGCSENFLKSRIPCTDYTYDEIDGKKIIRDYFWSQQLIDRLSQVKQHGVKAEDVKLIAEECCYGDCKWAEEMLASLARPKPGGKIDGAAQNGATKRPTKIVAKMQTHNRHPRKKSS